MTFPRHQAPARGRGAAKPGATARSARLNASGRRSHPDTISNGSSYASEDEAVELDVPRAAVVLNCDPHRVVKILEEGKIPHRVVGKQRLLRMSDVMRYKTEDQARRRAVLDQLVADAQEQGMGYGTT